MPPGPFGTVGWVGEKIADLPEGIEIQEHGATVCACGAEARWLGPPAPAGWECDNSCSDVRAYTGNNTPLFDLLDSLED